MIARTWPYGTRKAVKIIAFERQGDTYATACEDLSDPREAYVLIDGVRTIIALFHRPTVGQKRVIEFRQGGPTGGHWEMLDGLDISRADARHLDPALRGGGSD